MKVRTLTAIIALLIFLPILLQGGMILMLFAYLLALIALKELLNMNMIKFLSIPGLISALALVIIMLPQDAGDWVQVIQLKGLIAMSFIVLSYTVLSKNRFSFMDAAFCLMTVAYIGIGFMYFYETRSEGLHYILYAFLIVWLTDTGAYILGKLMGKHKLWPVISPNKTIEGFIGGIICSILVPLIMQFFVDFHMNIWTLLLVTIILSMFGQLGDLVESGFKRHFGVKDSGRILPGHGGILDRFDSFMFVLPLLNILLIQI
ncbi:phosphatidate cytidylyltransferase [Staphylococcus saccharolyticus]|uniref:Phosphatidate cytidylyltransferase n=1 Tax=Staphylococcus saccharolyticus TaxID=33028 RepID=A0A380H4X0_9STAP|nr:phosphatidate cytidylyltransferase [Staphylococcus saccharolyticus]MBL7565403.1 phosphatidate cytidylyltransferase [Staphylococcus saccharolyticus]MBL7571540.1 phosphatidate cytidylyltransferase [Staphylococcus saccharolyticus]QQB98055.1 phosphatidate cytidylyltransferase [Staphylococcus saccharolyticus]QRJ66090.1 phosphatidate cytidylyltransferase [Staphylococcus saccharolyticus]RTX97091.1 phosphatidate cytidylyltransferase [Staphylococcus saccharolyticus]